MQGSQYHPCYSHSGRAFYFHRATTTERHARLLTRAAGRLPICTKPWYLHRQAYLHGESSVPCFGTTAPRLSRSSRPGPSRPSTGQSHPSFFPGADPRVPVASILALFQVRSIYTGPSAFRHPLGGILHITAPVFPWSVQSFVIALPLRMQVQRPYRPSLMVNHTVYLQAGTGQTVRIGM